MKKLDFLYELRDALNALPREDIERYVDYYSEMIDDRMDDGMGEEDAVAEMGSVDEVAAKILGEVTLQEEKTEGSQSKAAEKSKYENEKRQLSGIAILLIILGFPVWFSLLAAVLSVVVSLFAALWSVVISLWAVGASFVGSAIGAAVLGTVHLVGGNLPLSVALIGVVLVCVGLAVLWFMLCKTATKGACKLTASSASAIKKLFTRKGEAK